ncbi:MAG: peptidoglycan DD-metalloendopeptidase family protein, partial [Thermomicrobiales bacterium]
QDSSGGYLGFDTPSFSAGQSVVVRTDDGGGLSLRYEASLDAERLSALGDGAVVRVVAGPYYDTYGNGWYLVTDGSLRAFAYAGFLAASNAGTAVLSNEGSTSSSSGYLGYDTPSFASGQRVVVRTDDGGGLSLRLEPSTSGEKLSAAADGASLTIVAGPYTDSAGNGWYLVTNGPLRAYAFAGFLVAGGSSVPDTASASPGSATDSSGYLGRETPQFSSGQTVIVQTDDGGGLSLRLEPSISSEKLSAARDGSTLTIVEGPVYDSSNNGWYLVTDGSLRAYAYAGFLIAGGSSVTASAETPTSNTTDSGNLGYSIPQFDEGQTVVVRTDDGGGLSLRMEANLSSEKLVALKDGTSLQIVQGPATDASGNGWYLVTDGAIRAYAFAGFLQASGTTPSSAPTSSATSSTASGNLGFDTPQFSEGQTVAVQTDTGGGLSLRMEPNTTSEQLLALKEGVTLSVVQGPVYDTAGNGWYLVTNGSIRAYAYAGFLTASSQPAATSSAASSSASSTASSGSTFSIGQRATTEGVTNVRNGATVNGALNGNFRGGDIVEITDGPFFDRNQDAWYYIVGDSVQGFVKGEFLIAAAAQAAEQPAASNDFIYPLAKYTFTQAYGCSNLGFYSYNAAWGCRVHNGIDLSAPFGTPILASAGGTVVEAGWCDCGLGYYVKIDHGNGLSTYYGHMQSMPYVSVGDVVSQGETIGPVGSTGLSTGPHTHFMVQKNGVTVDPMDYL